MPGTEAEVVLERDGKRLVRTLTLQQRPVESRATEPLQNP